MQRLFLLGLMFFLLIGGIRRGLRQRRDRRETDRGTDGVDLDPSTIQDAEWTDVDDRDNRPT